MSFLALALVLGATARLTLLVTHDSFPPVRRPLDAIRGRLFERALDAQPPGLLRTQLAAAREAVDRHWWIQLTTCPWCCSFWIALPIAAAGYWAPTAWWFMIPTAALTGSLAAGALAQLRS